MLKALPLVHFCSVLLLKEQTMTSVRKMLKTLVWSAQSRLISSEICLKNNYKIHHFLPIAFWWSLPWKLPQNCLEISWFFREFIPKNPAKFDFFFRDLSEALLIMLLGWSLTRIASFTPQKYQWGCRSTDLQSNQENRERLKYFWNVIVLQERNPIRYEKTEPQARTLISLWFCG